MPGPLDSSDFARRVAPIGAVRARERSFKVLPGRVLTDRVLLSYAVARTRLRSAGGLGDLQQAIGIPESAMARVAPALGDTDWLHLGYEGGDGRRWCKMYLESQRGVFTGGGGVGSVLVHRSWKWNLDDPSSVVEGQYWGTVDPVPDVVNAAIDAAVNSESIVGEVVRGVVESARARTTSSFLLEVVEFDTERRSIDLNLYPAGLVGSDVVRLVAPAIEAHGRSRSDQVMTERFLCSRVGHIAAGQSRCGEEFLTVYVSAENGSAS